MDIISNICGTNRFLSNVLKLVTGTAIGQIFGILAMPLITRLYDPHAFGLSSIFFAFVGVIGGISCLRYEISIMLPEKDEDAANLLALSLLFNVIISLLMIPAVLLFSPSIMNILNAPELKNYVWLIPPLIFLCGASLAFTYWNLRLKKFGLISANRIASSAVTSTSQLTLGLSGYANADSLIYSNVFSSLISDMILVFPNWEKSRRFFGESINLPDMIILLKRYDKFPKYDLWSTLLNSLSLQMPILLLSIFFSSTIVGYYSLGLMVLQLPMALIGGAISQVFFQQASKAKLNGKLDKLVADTFSYLIIICLYPLFLFLVQGKTIFVLAFGLPWAEAGFYAQILIFWIFCVFITAPMSTVFMVLDEQRTLLIFNIAIFILRTSALIVGGMTGDVIKTLVLYSVVGVLTWGIMCIWILRQSNANISDKSKNIFICFAFSVIISSSLGLIEHFAQLGTVIYVGMGGLFGIIYYLFIFRIDLHKINSV